MPDGVAGHGKYGKLLGRDNTRVKTSNVFVHESCQNPASFIPLSCMDPTLSREFTEETSVLFQIPYIESSITVPFLQILKMPFPNFIPSHLPIESFIAGMYVAICLPYAILAYLLMPLRGVSRCRL